MLKRNVTRVSWPSILLPPHNLSVDVIPEKVSLYHMVVSLDKVRFKDNLSSCLNNPHHNTCQHLVQTLQNDFQGVLVHMVRNVSHYEC